MNSSGQTIRLNGFLYPIDQLPEVSFFKTAFERSAVSFIKEWQSGKEEFKLHTSGSTGTPKEIQVTRAQMKSSAHQTALALSLKGGMTALLCLDSRYIAGQMMLVRSLETRMNIVSVNPSANPFDQLEEDIKIDFAAFVPYQLQSILASSQASRLNQLSCAIIGGAPLEASTRLLLSNFKCTFYATYGMTETVSHIALQQLNGNEASDYFRVLPGVKISQDDRGCLIAEADYILNKKVITNDVIELISSQEFRWLGRADNIINSGGIKIFPEQVERTIALMMKDSGISNRFFLAAQKDLRLGQRLVLIMEGEAIHLDKKSILEKLRNSLPPYHHPKDIFLINPFVDTATGKVNRPATLAKIPHLAPQE